MVWLMTDRQLLILITGMILVVLLLVYQINGVDRDEVVWFVGFIAGAAFIYAIYRGRDDL